MPEQDETKAPGATQIDEDDVEGHLGAMRIDADDDDVEGHLGTMRINADDDDVEGHAFGLRSPASRGE